MLLRIIDNSAAGAATTAVELVLDSGHSPAEEVDSYAIASYTSPFTNNFKQVFRWYVNDYLLGHSNGEDRADVVGKLIKFGRFMGDELLGENHQLLRFIAKIEALGYAQLQVQLESQRIEFFDEFWETLILPEANYFLAGAARSFTRKYRGDGFAEALPTRHLKLAAASTQRDQMAQLLGEGPAEQAADTPHSPLRVLRISVDPQHSLAVKTSIADKLAGDAISHSIALNPSPEAVSAQLKRRDQPIHLVHYSGAIALVEGQACVQLAASESPDHRQWLNVAEFAASLVQAGVALLLVDATEYTTRDHADSTPQPVQPSLGLASVAYAAQKQGLSNVIGLSEISVQWLNQQCFDSVYTALLQGFSIAQATVEARKNLQKNVQSVLATPVAIPFHPWSLLTHYGMGDVVFFREPQTLVEAHESPELAKLHNRLFGFRSELLPPLLQTTADGLALPLSQDILAATQATRGRAATVMGDAGTGKTHLTHVTATYIVQQQWVDYCFYYDFESNSYDADDMLAMIAPIFELAATAREAILQRLGQHICCFVVDGMHATAEPQRAALGVLFAELQAMGHYTIGVLDTSAVSEPQQQEALAALIGSTSRYQVTPLDGTEEKIFASQCIQQSADSSIPLDDDWHALLASMEGHPWLIAKALPLVKQTDIKTLRQLLRSQVMTTDQPSKVTSFYHWQWQQLTPAWQKLLLLLSEQQALLLETLMIAADHKDGFPPAKALLANLGKADAVLAEVITELELAGWLTRMPHGRVLDARIKPFIAEQQAAAKIEFSEQTRLQFSQTLCEGIRLLAQHVLKQPNPAISNNLLFNRRFWVKHFETLWFEQDYRGFIGVKQAFEQLLAQAKLQHESRQWSLDLLARTPIARATDDSPMESKLAWLMLAAGALDDPKGAVADAAVPATLAEAAELWQQWFNTVDDDPAQEQLPLFQQVAAFLELYYRSQQGWRDSIAVCQKAVAIYRHHQAWRRVIQCLRSQANYQAQLGEHDAALATEERIFNDIPYDDSPPGFKAQQMLEVLMSRVGRQATEAAQTLLDAIRATEDGTRLAEMLDGLQCDLFYQQQRYREALPFYCRIWAKSLQTEQQAQIAQLRQRLLDLQEKVGSEVFMRCFTATTPAGTPLPREHGSVPT